jgi:uncharacterized membrane protein
VALVLRAVTYLALVLGLLIAGLGIFGILAPADFGAAMHEVQRRSNVYFIAAARVLLGVIIVLAATNSRTPFLLGTLGVLIALAGVLSPFMAMPLRNSVQRWMADGNPVSLQVYCAVALATGAFIVYATMPRRKS